MPKSIFPRHAKSRAAVIEANIPIKRERRVHICKINILVQRCMIIAGFPCPCLIAPRIGDVIATQRNPDFLDARIARKYTQNILQESLRTFFRWQDIRVRVNIWRLDVQHLQHCAVPQGCMSEILAEHHDAHPLRADIFIILQERLIRRIIVQQDEILIPCLQEPVHQLGKTANAVATIDEDGQMTYGLPILRVHFHRKGWYL